MIARDLIESARVSDPDWAAVLDTADSALWAGVLSINAVARELGWSRRRAAQAVHGLREYLRRGGHA